MGFFAGLNDEKYDRQYKDNELVQRMVNYFNTQISRLVYASIVIILLAVIGAALPVIVSRIVDMIQSQPSPSVIFTVGLALVGVAFGLWGLNWLRRGLIVRAVGDVVLDMRSRAFRAAAELARRALVGGDNARIQQLDVRVGVILEEGQQRLEVENGRCQLQRPHKRALPLRRAHHPLVRQQVDRPPHRHRADVVRAAQLRLGRQLVAGAEAARGNLAAQNVGQLHVCRLLCLPVDCVRVGRFAGGSFHLNAVLTTSLYKYTL